MSKEPVLIVTVVTILLGLAVSFGLDVTADQTKWIMAAAALVGGFISRSNVTPTP